MNASCNYNVNSVIVSLKLIIWFILYSFLKIQIRAGAAAGAALFHGSGSKTLMNSVARIVRVPRLSLHAIISAMLLPAKLLRLSSGMLLALLSLLLPGLIFNLLTTNYAH